MEKPTPVIKQIKNIPQIIAGDACFLQEIFHPDRDPVSIRYSLAYAYVEPGGKTLNHFLEQTEVYYILSGNGLMYLDNEPFDIEQGVSYCIPPRCEQWLLNTGTSRIEFLVIVDPAWTAEEEVVLE